MGENRFKARVSLPANQPDNIRERIKAKAQLWDFLHDISENIISWPYSDNELAEQFISSAFTILLPHFDGIEIETEVRNLYRTIKREPPKDFIAIYTDAFQRFIAARLSKLK